MPSGVNSAQERALIQSILVVDGDEMHTIQPLYKYENRTRVRVAERFVGRQVEVEVWPTREADHPLNTTWRECRVLTACFNATWGHKGTSVLVLEFDEPNRRDLPIPMSTVHAIRTID
jgi:hypothetical protein